MNKNENSKFRLDYSWVIVCVCFLMILITLGFCSSNRSLYLAAITEALDIKRSAFSLTDSFRFVATSVVNLFFGALVHKFGTKKLIFAGFVSLIISTILYSVSTSLIVFYIAGIFLGIGFSWTGTTIVGCVINDWCSENKGTIMGAVLAANGIGGAIAAQLVTPLIFQESTPFGYKDAYKLVTAILVFTLVIVMIFYKEKPKNSKFTAPAKKKHRGQSWVGIPFEEAVKKPYFWLALICIFFTGLVLQGINGVAAAHMKDVGISVEFIATALSFSSISLAVFKFLTGFLYDRAGLRITMSVCDAAAMLAMLTLAFLSPSPFGKVLAFSYGIISSLALPLETIMLPIFAGDIFGQKAYNKILGLFVSVNTAGYAVGIPLVNLSFDLFGTYKPMFLVCFIMMLAITLIFQYIAKEAQKQRDIVNQTESV